MTRRVILWRHGRTEWNVAGRVQGQSDIPLDDVGRGQAAEAALRLASLKPTLIVSSDLSRAAATAQALGDVTGVPVVLDPRFRELNFGAREGLTWAQAWQQFPDAMQAWINGDETQIEGSETHRQAGDRFAAGLRDLVATHDDQTIVVVAHGAVIRTGTCSFLGIPDAHWRQFGGLSNCHWNVLEEWKKNDWAMWVLREWNTGSLPEPVISDDDEL
jgi:broad specificity phosphatase PhoE